MDQLDLLCCLENNYNLLLDYEDQKKHLKENFLHDSKKINIINIQKDIELLKNKNEMTKSKLKKTEKLLKEHNYIIKEIEEILYSGNTKDIKKLEILNEEKNTIKDTINKTETKVLEYMEEIEESKKRLINMEKLLKDITKQNENQKINYLNIEKNLNEKIANKKIEIDKLEDKIDKELLVKYKLIRKNKTKGLVEMKNDVCTGCNMGIPKYIAQKVKNNKDINYCDNCGRILCKQKA